MALEQANTCPNCGSTLIRKTDSGLECANCNTRFMNPYDTRSTNIHIYRDEAKIEKIRSKERQSKSDNRTFFIVLTILILIVGGCFFALYEMIEIKAPAGHAGEYRGKDVAIVTSIFKDAGFRNVQTISLHDAEEGDREYNLVSTIYIGGDDSWENGVIFKSRKDYKKGTPVKIYYHGP